jgi:hypothetical protein
LAVLTFIPPISAQDAAAKEAQAHEAAKGKPARATPADYQAHTQVGQVTLAAEFTGHSVPTQKSTLSNENYIVVELALFGATPDAHTIISTDDFSLRINDNKKALPSQPYAMSFEQLKDPEWEPPVPVESKSKTGINAGGNDSGSTPAPVHPPFALKRGWEQSVQKAALPEGDRQLPVAGLLFFRYGGKDKGIYSVELVYSGSAGKTTLALHP